MEFVLEATLIKHIFSVELKYHKRKNTEKYNVKQINAHICVIIFFTCVPVRLEATFSLLYVSFSLKKEELKEYSINYENNLTCEVSMDRGA